MYMKVCRHLGCFAGKKEQACAMCGIQRGESYMLYFMERKPVKRVKNRCNMHCFVGIGEYLHSHKTMIWKLFQKTLF